MLDAALNSAIHRTEQAKAAYERRRKSRALVKRMQNLWDNTLTLCTPQQWLRVCYGLLAGGVLLGYLSQSLGLSTSSSAPIPSAHAATASDVASIQLKLSHSLSAQTKKPQ